MAIDIANPGANAAALTAALVALLPGGGTQTIVTDATTTRTLALGDADVLIKMTSGSANTITVPPNSAVAFPIGTIIDVVMYGAGQTSFIAGVGVTINPPLMLAMDGQYSRTTLQKIATDEWLLTGSAVGGGGGGGGTELFDENDVALEDENSVILEEE